MSKAISSANTVRKDYHDYYFIAMHLYLSGNTPMNSLGGVHVVSLMESGRGLFHKDCYPDYDHCIVRRKLDEDLGLTGFAAPRGRYKLYVEKHSGNLVLGVAV